MGGAPSNLSIVPSDFSEDLVFDSDESVRSNSLGQITHDCSDHYELKSDANVVFFCDGCKMEGCGERYVCNLCHDMLHKWCRYPKIGEVIIHDYFERSTFIFTETPTTIFVAGVTLTQVFKRCASCRDDIRGFSYHCEAESLDLHPGCYKLDRRRYFDNKVFNLHKKMSSVCIGCKQINSHYSDGWGYVSSCNNYHYHVRCFMERVYQFHTAHQMEEDVSSVFQSETQSGGMTSDQAFMNHLTGAAAPKEGIFGRITFFFKNLCQQVIAGVTVTSEKVWNIAKTLWFKITTEWCAKIVDFFRKIKSFYSSVLPHMRAGLSGVTVELVQKIAKNLNLNIPREQCEKFFFFLQIILTLAPGPVRQFY